MAKNTAILSRCQAKYIDSISRFCKRRIKKYKKVYKV